MKSVNNIVIALMCVLMVGLNAVSLDANAQTPAKKTQSVDSLISAATKSYDSGAYTQAAEYYEAIAKEYGTSANLMADLGNAYMRAGDYGHAMLAYQKALKLNPSLSSVKDNIEYLTGKVADNNRAEAKSKKISVNPDPSSFFSSVKEYITRSHLSDTWALWAGITFVLFIACGALYVFTKNVLLRKIGFFGTVPMFAISVITLVCAFATAAQAQSADRGVITGYKVNLLYEPFSTAHAVAAPLTRGTVMTILDTETNSREEVEWYKVRLNSDYVGWLPAAEFDSF